MRITSIQCLLVLVAYLFAGCVARLPPAAPKLHTLLPVLPAKACTVKFTNSPLVLDALNSSAGQAHGVPGTVHAVKKVAPAQKTELARLNLHAPSGINAFACSATLTLTGGATARGSFYVYRSSTNPRKLDASWIPGNILNAAKRAGQPLTSSNAKESRAFTANANLCFAQWHIASIVRTHQLSGWSEKKTERYVVKKYARASRPRAQLSGHKLTRLAQRITTELYSAVAGQKKDTFPGYSAKRFLLKCLRQARH